MIKLGDKVKDKISGFSGIAVARTDWLYGCTRFGVNPQELTKDGGLIDCQWFDGQQLEVITPAKITADFQETVERPAGGRDDPIRNYDPER